MKSIQQFRIHHFLSRIPKPRSNIPYSFTNDLVKKLCCKTSKEIVKKDLNGSEIMRILPISSSINPEIKSSNSNFFEKKVMKIQKQLFERVNPMKNQMNFMNFNEYSVIQKKYMIDSISNNNETVDILEKEKKMKKKVNSFTIEENWDFMKKMRNSMVESKRYIMTSPSHKNNIRQQTDESLKTTIREKEIINIHLKKYFGKKINTSYKLI